MKVTLDFPIPEVDALQKELEQARRIIETKNRDIARLEAEIVELNEGRISNGRTQFSEQGYYALRNRYRALRSEIRRLA